MSILSGFKKFKKHIKTTDGNYAKVSEWTDSSTVETPNGIMLSERLTDGGNIITDEYINGYYICSSPSSSNYKSITVGIGSTFKLYDGKRINVMFGSDDTSTSTKELILLDDSGSTLISADIYYKGALLTNNILKKNIIYTFEYNNHTWYVHGDIDGTGVISLATTTFKGASSSSDGTIGLVPAPSSTDYPRVLCSDGTWKDMKYKTNGLAISSHGVFTIESEIKRIGTGTYIYNLTENCTVINFYSGGSDILNADDENIYNVMLYLTKKSNTEYSWKLVWDEINRAGVTVEISTKQKCGYNFHIDVYGQKHYTGKTTIINTETISENV